MSIALPPPPIPTPFHLSERKEVVAKQHETESNTFSLKFHLKNIYSKYIQKKFTKKITKNQSNEKIK